MDFFTIITKWFWAICIAIAFVNAGILRFRAQRYMRENPDLADGYAKIFRGLVIWGNIPLIVMVIGCLFGGVPSVLHFFRPRDGDPFVLALFASVFFIWIMGTYWLFCKNGAETLVKHPGLLNSDFKSPTTIKIFWLLCLAGGVFGVILMFTLDIPVPP